MQVSQNVATSVHRAAERESPLSQLLLLGKIGIAGGLAGKPVGLTLRDFLPDFEVEIWKRITDGFPDDTIVDICSQSDVKKQRRSLENLRVVLLHPTKNWYEEFVCLIERKRGTGVPLPAVLSRYTAKSSETPGATLLATYQEKLGSQLTELLLQGYLAPPQKSDREEISDAELLKVSTHRLMKSIRKACEKKCNLSLKEYKILDGLVTGAAIKGRENSVNLKDQQNEVAPEHYGKVRSLLQCPLLGSIQKPHDWLELAMLKRANAYMDGNVSQKTEISLFARQGDSSTTAENNQQTEARTVTRRDLVELGDRNSKILKALVQTAVRNLDKSKLESLCLPAALIDRICAHPSDNHYKLVLIHGLKSKSADA